MPDIRRATVDDAAALAEIAERTFRDAFAADNNPDDLELHIANTYGEVQQRREIASLDGITLVVEDDGRLIAYTQIRRAPSQHGDVEIARFYVDRTHHGRGVAQSLMDAAQNAARALGGTTLWLGVWERNPRAIAFYEKCGFRDVGSHPFLVGTDLQTDRAMSRVIPPG
ncbi:MAG TPA: GNAT family N-acetyltransferase [Thermoanaerobaculia bacterium]|nr:GNAT family N-acetyltransferase [Thermoanaerobaculia bacterium]